MDSGIDTGPVLGSRRLSIPSGATSVELHHALARLGADLLLSVLKDMIKGRYTPIPQSASGVYASKIRREEGRIRWGGSAVTIDRQVRAFNPWPGVWFHAGKERIKVYECTLVRVPDSRPAGTLLDSRFTVACGQGALRLEQVQRPGRAILEGADCLRGLPLSPGDRLDDG